MAMKKLLSVLLLVLLFHPVFSQRENLKPFRVELGYVLHVNSLNEDNYYKFMYPNYNVKNAAIHGINLKFSSFLHENLDLIYGAILEVGGDKYGSSNWNSGISDSYDYVLNGGGIYFGLNSHSTGKHFGIDADIAAGIMAYKEYRVVFNNSVEPFVDKYDKKSSFMGGMASLGFYLRGDRIGISPELNAILAGGSSGSFMFIGFNVPLTVSF
jgi:hypothetical protein